MTNLENVNSLFEAQDDFIKGFIAGGICITIGIGLTYSLTRWLFPISNENDLIGNVESVVRSKNKHVRFDESVDRDDLKKVNQVIQTQVSEKNQYQ